MYETLIAYSLGAILSGGMVHAARFMPTRIEQRYWTIFAAIVFVGFPPFPLTNGDLAGFWYELAVYGVVLALLIASRWLPASLAILYLAHGAWDLMHLTAAVTIDKPDWITQICVPFDWVVGIYVLSRLGPWRRGRPDSHPQPTPHQEERET
jgi:hypothetical protein